MVLMTLLSSKGPAVKHFGWSQDFCRGIYTILWFTVCISLPCRFFSMALITFESGIWSDSLGRLFFLGSIGSLAAGIWFGSRWINRACDAALVERGFKIGRAERRRSNERLLNGDSIDSSVLNAAEPWTALPRRFVIFCLPFVTLSLAAMSIVGYHFTAFEMSSRAFWSVQALSLIHI